MPEARRRDTAREQRRGISFDDLFGAREDRRRDRQAERLSSLEIDHQLEFCRLLDRQIRRLGAIENFSDVNADLAMDRRKAGAIADQTTSLGVYTPRINRRNRLTYGQCYQLLAMAFEKRISLDDQAVGAQLGEGSEGGADLAFAACVQDREQHRLHTGRLLHVPDCRSGLRKAWVNQQGDHLGPREQVAEQLEPLGDKLLVENGEPREVAAWPRKTGDQPSRNRVLADERNDRDRRGRFFRREGGGFPAVCRDHIDLAADELRREAGQPIIMVLRPPV